MFKTGEKVVYPMQGAGEIESIEEREVLGGKQRYYVIRLLIGGMRAMVPVETSEKVGLRLVIEKEKVNEILDILKGNRGKIEIIPDWKVRYTTNLKKMKSGCIYNVAEVVRSLSCQNRKKGLSSGEQRLFNNACLLIAGELSYARNESLKQTNLMLEEILQRPLDLSS